VDLATERVWKAHPLAAQHRLVLLAVAAAAEGKDHRWLTFSRRQLAEKLEMSAAVVTRALSVGEQMGLCEVDRRTGRVAMRTDALPLDGGESAPSSGAATASVTVADPPPPEVLPSTGLTTRAALQIFAEAWQAKYRQRYGAAVDNRWSREMKFAADLARAFTADELRLRVRNYMEHPDPFYAQCAHALSVFYKNPNKFAVSGGRSLGERGMLTVDEIRQRRAEAR
jgi:hypothetical protein